MDAQIITSEALEWWYTSSSHKDGKSVRATPPGSSTPAFLGYLEELLVLKLNASRSTIITLRALLTLSGLRLAV